MDQKSTDTICHICEKEYSCKKAKNRHIKLFHPEEPPIEVKTKHIKCPLCPEEEKTPFVIYNHLINQIKEIHVINIEESYLDFRNMEEFESWRALDNRNVDYITTGWKGKHIHYNGNPSNTKGWESLCSKRRLKTGGSI